MENKKYVIGADIGGTTVKLGLFEEDGTLLEKWEIPTVIEGDGTAVLRDIAAEIQKCREKHNIPADGILGVGAGIPGPVTADGGVHRCVNLGWGVFDVRTALEETVGLPVVVVNDANAAAMGEAWKGGGRGSENVVFITLGTGVGGAVISDGRMVAGANGAAGEFGHMTINPAETETCACGRRVDLLRELRGGDKLALNAQRVKRAAPRRRQNRLRFLAERLCNLRRIRILRQTRFAQFDDLKPAECGKPLCVFLHGVTPIFFFELTDANQLYLQHIVSLC